MKKLSSLDKKIIWGLQEGIPIVKYPYQSLAKKVGISEEELIRGIKDLKEKGVIRRIGAMVGHRKIGFKWNAMVVWRVEEEKIEEAGKIMADFPEVSHCYVRKTYPDWPYNLYIMIHGRTKKRCEEVATKISKIIKINDYKLIYSFAEYKKISPVYFREEV